MLTIACPDACVPAVELRTLGQYRQAMYRAIIALVLAALTIWSVLWFVSQRTYRDSLLALAANLQDSGLAVRHSDLRIRGYPNRLDATIKDLFIADPAKGNEWRAPFLQLMMLSYSTDHIIAAWPEQQELRISGQPYAVNSDGLKASLETGGRSSEIERFVVESNRLGVDGLPFTFEPMLLALRQREDRTSGYELSLRAGLPEATPSPERNFQLRIPAGNGNFSANMHIDFDRPLSGSTCVAGGGRILKLHVRQAELAWPSLSLRGEADLSFSEAGLASGTTTLTVSDPKALLELVERNLPDSETIRSIATRIAGLRPQEVSIPFTVRDGKVSLAGLLGTILGDFEIADIPPLRICPQAARPASFPGALPPPEVG